MIGHVALPERALGPGEERIAPGIFSRFVSNMKDAIAYFAPSALFRRKGRAGNRGRPPSLPPVLNYRWSAARLSPPTARARE